MVEVEQLTNQKSFKQIQDYIDRMPSLSTTVTKVLEICNHPNTSPNDLNKVISLDPVLTGQVLRLINSAYYSLPNQITSLTRAIVMLGLNTVKNLALSTAILGTMGKEESFQSLPMDPFWTHSICVGVSAKVIANMLGVPLAIREEYFIAGLLHDLGKIPLNSCFPKHYRQALDLAKNNQAPLYRAETLVFGFNHGLVGRMIAKKWQLNETITSSLSHHHDLENIEDDESKRFIAIVALANLYANVYDYGSAGDLFPSPKAIYNALQVVGISWHALAEMNPVVENEIDKAQVFLQVSRESKL